MINVCPFCGKSLAEALVSAGLSACLNCNKLLKALCIIACYLLAGKLEEAIMICHD